LHRSDAGEKDLYLRDIPYDARAYFDEGERILFACEPESTEHHRRLDADADLGAGAVHVRMRWCWKHLVVNHIRNASNTLGIDPDPICVVEIGLAIVPGEENPMRGSQHSVC